MVFLNRLWFCGAFYKIVILKVDKDTLFRARMGRGAIAWITFLMEKIKQQIRYLCQQHLVETTMCVWHVWLWKLGSWIFALMQSFEGGFIRAIFNTVMQACKSMTLSLSVKMRLLCIDNALKKGWEYCYSASLIFRVHCLVCKWVSGTVTQYSTEP